MSYQSKAKRLMDECGWNEANATASARAGGRCEYCGCDLLHDRLGHEVAVVDHLLPKSEHQDLEDCSENWVLSCRFCNTVKSRWDPVKDEPQGTRESLRDNRERLIDKVRAYIYGKRAKGHDPVWLRARRIMDG